LGGAAGLVNKRFDDEARRRSRGLLGGGEDNVGRLIAAALSGLDAVFTDGIGDRLILMTDVP
jgi:hypothetical protein